MHATSTLKARELRKNATDAEKLLWQRLRSKQVGGLKFRRQEPIGYYIVDFVCFSHKLVIELDGGHHAQPDQKQYDHQRDEWLRGQGFVVLRFWNSDVFENIEGVMESIYGELLGGVHRPFPSREE